MYLSSQNSSFFTVVPGKRAAQLSSRYRNPAWSNGRLNTHNFVNFAPINLKFWHNILHILCIHLKLFKKYAKKSWNIFPPHPWITFFILTDCNDSFSIFFLTVCSNFLGMKSTLAKNNYKIFFLYFRIFYFICNFFSSHVTLLYTRRNSSLQNLVLLYLFLLKVNRKLGYNVTFV